MRTQLHALMRLLICAALLTAVGCGGGSDEQVNNVAENPNLEPDADVDGGDDDDVELDDAGPDAGDEADARPEADAENDAGNDAASEDDTAPSFGQIFPRDGRSVRGRQVWLTGSVADGELAAVVVRSAGGEVEVELSEEGVFGARFALTPGLNTFEIVASDAAGNSAEQSHTVYFGNRAVAGGAHSGVIIDGAVYAWGRNNRGQVGLGYTSRLGDTEPAHPMVAHQIDLGATAVSLAFSQNSSFALSDDGRVFAWGDNDSGQLCLGADAHDETLDEAHRHAPAEVALAESIVAIARGYDHTLFLTATGQVLACGSNDAGQLGDATTEDRDAPVAVEGLSDVVALAAGSSNSYALTASGEVFAWGANRYGALGTGSADEDAHPAPQKVAGLSDVVDIAAGKAHVIALSETGEVFGFGLNASTQVGPEAIANEEGDVYSPVALAIEPEAVGVVAGGNQSFIFASDGRVYGWGQNGFGNLGIPGEDDLAAPGEPVFGLENLTDLGVGALHTVGLRADGTVFSWGWSFEGSLGAGESAINAWSYRIPLLVEFAE
jgi:alpha-tubulin suppressor-like RCC1 family protein